MNLVEIYTKPKCHLCEVAKVEILELKTAYHFAFIEIDITGSNELFEKYKDEIPVIFLNSNFICRYKFDKDAFVKNLNEQLN